MCSNFYPLIYRFFRTNRLLEEEAVPAFLLQSSLLTNSGVMPPAAEDLAGAINWHFFRLHLHFLLEALTRL